MRALVYLGLLLAGALGGFAIYTFGWQDNGGDTGDGRVLAIAYANEITRVVCGAGATKGCVATEFAHVTGNLWRARILRPGTDFCVHIDVKRFEPTLTRFADALPIHGAALFDCG